LIENDNIIDITQIDAKEIIKEEYYSKYKQDMKYFFNELCKLSVNMYIINKIRKFPFDLFTTPDKRIFLLAVLGNLFEYSIVMISRLVVDKRKDVFTLLHFKNSIIGIIKPEYSERFKTYIKKAKLDNKIDNILDKVKTLRNKRFAHFDKKYNFNPKQIDKIYYSELEDILDYLNFILNLLAFDRYYDSLPVFYNKNVQHPKGSDSRSDIEIILDNIVKQSTIINAPEDPDKWQKILWEKDKSNMTQKEINNFNIYRNKFDLPEI
jgi:hypothetical protein